MVKKIAVILFYVLVPAGIFTLLGFAIQGNTNLPCNSFYVKVSGNWGNNFVDSASVVKLIYSRFDTLPGQPVKNLSLRKMESLVNEMYYVENSQVYRTIDGDVVVKIRQRDPIARVINNHNESFYIDNNGRLMKTTPRYAARVVIVTGHIPSRYSPSVDLSATGNLGEISKSEEILRELYALINHIDQDDFLKSWVDQIYVTRTGGFELIPKNGAHVIEFGDIRDMEEKFSKLMLFYLNSLTHIGWHHYKRINLKYKNQIVCSK